MLLASDDPLDHYLVAHPQAVLAEPVEACGLDPANPYVLLPHLAAAAAEVPLTPADEAVFGPGTLDLAAELERLGFGTSSLVSTGDGVDVGPDDLLAWWAGDGRTDAGLSLRELEERSGVYAARISKLELLQQGAQPRTARKLADALGVEVRDLRRDPSAGRAGE